MSGHSKWSTIKRAKAITDAKKGAIFTRLGNAITLAAKNGGDPEMNPSLKAAIDKAKASNMPKDNIERAVKKGTGELAGAQIDELYYEGIGPLNIQFVIKCLTDNKNRSASTVRHTFTKVGGSFGSVMWNFDQLGVVRVNREELDNKNAKEDELELSLIDLGMIDMETSEEGITIYSNSKDLHNVKGGLESYNLEVASAEIEYVAKEKIEISGADQERLDKFIEELEDNEDVGDYYTNLK